MTYYPVNNMLVSLPNTNSTIHSGSSGLNTHGSSSHHAHHGNALLGGSPALPTTLPPPPSQAALSKTLSHGHRGSDFQGFGTVHRSQKIYL